MKKRSRAGGEPIKGRRQKTPELKLRGVPKMALRPNSSPDAQETEVARLSRELHDALERQAATSEVLSMVSTSSGELDPVFHAILEKATRICEANFGLLFRLDNGVVQTVVMLGLHQALAEVMKPGLKPGPNTATARAIRTGRPIHIPDIRQEKGYREGDPMLVAGADKAGIRTLLAVPMVHNQVPIGSIGIYRTEVRPFTEKQIELVESFAAQAVIAIENARLLNELRQRTTDLTERTADLTEALDQQTATSEVLEVISRFPGGLEPVFQAMLEKAVRICDAKFGSIVRWDNEAAHLVATHNAPPAFAEARRRSPNPANPKTSFGRMIATKAVVHVADAAAEPGYVEQHDQAAVEAVELGGQRTALYVPMLKESELIGAFTLSRQEVRPFTDKQIELVQNFAAQAVIAIENARLLNELRERTDEVVKLNQHLEQRVTDQVGEIERMGRLRRFLPPQVADLIVASGAEKQLESHRREITALFCDLRGFTGFTESADAEDVMALLRDYHAAIGEIIIKYNGTLERYAGDGVMVVFNDPVPVENPPLQAVLMALEVRDAIGSLTETWRRLGHDIGFGIGIAHGFATLGTIGFEGRFDYAAIGTVSNVASLRRSEARTNPHQSASVNEGRERGEGRAGG
jgi:GAF domain-containing protein